MPVGACTPSPPHTLTLPSPSGFSTASTVDSARANLAASFVNGFVNAAFGEDKLLTLEGNKWIYKNKGVGMLSATASLGLVLLWDVEGGLTQIDKFLYSNDDSVKVCFRLHPVPTTLLSPPDLLSLFLILLLLSSSSSSSSSYSSSSSSSSSSSPRQERCWLRAL